jgi:predicted exporter
MKSRKFWGAAMVWLVAAGALVYCGMAFRASADVVDFLPTTIDDDRRAIAQTIARSNLAQTTIVSIHGDPERASTAAREVARILAAHPDIEWVQAGPDPALEKTWFDLFFPARFGFLSDRPEAELPVLLSDAGLAEVARTRRNELAGPLGALTARWLSADPFLIFKKRLEQLQNVQPETLRVEDGLFVAESDDRRIIFLATRASAFDSDKQSILLGLIAETVQKHDSDGDLTLEMSGVNRIAVAAAESTQKDIQRVSTGSLIGTLAFFLLVFGSARYFFVLLLPSALGILGGLAVCLAGFGYVNGVALAFAGTLIGSSADYSSHFLQHHVLEPARGGPHKTLQIIWPGLLLGGVTTIVGFICMAATSTPGMQQIAIFGGVGVACALVTTYFLLPTLVAKKAKIFRPLAVTQNVMKRFLGGLTRYRRFTVIVPMVAIALCALAWPRMSWNDDLQAFMDVDPNILAEDERVRSVLMPTDPGRFVVASAPDEETAIEKNDAVYQILLAAQQAGELEGFRSLHSLLWSRKLQQQNLDALAQSPELAKRLDAAMKAAGFRPDTTAAFGKALGQPTAPIGIDAFADGPLEPLFHGFRVKTPERTLILTRLWGVTDAAALEKRVDTIPGTMYFDQAQYFGDVYASFRRRVMAIIAGSLVLVFLILFARYRDLRESLASFLPAIFAAATTLAVLSLVGVTLNLLHVLGLLLILSMGVDYGVFVVEAQRKQDATNAMVGITLSCVTTVLSFGLLAMSSIPALRALGTTAAIGITLSFLLTPVALTMSRARA